MKSTYYKMAINMGPFRYYQNSKVYEISDGKNSIMPGLKYSLVTLLLGWWSISLRNPLLAVKNSLEALHVNFSGGEDISNIVSEQEYDGMTNYVWNNLLRTTTDKISKNELVIILEIQDEYEFGKQEIYDKENEDFIISNLKKVNVESMDVEIIQDVFDALKNYKRK